jgi:hypothetical protein
MLSDVVVIATLVLVALPIALVFLFAMEVL